MTPCVPCRSLEPERLKLSGTGTWDPSSFLGGSLWMASMEPASMEFREEPINAEVPDLSKESYDAVPKLAKLWDARGLLFLGGMTRPLTRPASSRFRRIA